MNAQDLAALLDHRQYGREITRDESRKAAEHGLVVVYGASDDLIEFEGAISDEQGASNKSLHYLSGDGLLRSECDEDECPYFARLIESAKTVQAMWDSEGFSWTYVTDIPHATFVVLEDSEKYCRGIVFALADVGGAA